MGHSIFYPHPPYGRHDSDRPFAPNSVSDTSVYSKIRIRHPEFVIVHRFQRTNNCRTISSQSFRSVAQKRHQFWVRDWANLQICSLLTDKNRGKFPTARTRTNSRLYLRDAGSGISNTTAITRFNICSNHPSGGTPIWNRRGCSSEILDLTPKGDHLGVAQAFRDPIRRPIRAWLKTPERHRLKTHEYDMQSVFNDKKT